MDFSEVLDKECINLELDSTEKDGVINELANLLYENHKINNLEKFIDDVYKREDMGVTGMGNGIAIPHGVSEQVKNPCVAIGKAKSEIKWESIDDTPVRLIFLMAVPDGDNNKQHLKILSKLSSFLAYESNIKMIMESKNNEQVINYLEEYLK